MTRDGAVSVNLVTGETTYPSDRTPEQDHSASGDTAGAAGKAVDRGYFVFGLPSWYLASFRIRVWDVPNKHFSGLGGGFPKAKNRKRVLACCACYRFSLRT